MHRRRSQSTTQNVNGKRGSSHQKRVVGVRNVSNVHESGEQRNGCEGGPSNVP